MPTAGRPCRSAIGRFLPALAVLAGLVAAGPSPAAAPDAAGGGRLILDDAPLPLEPKVAPSAQEQDRLESLALFSAARALQHRGENAAALRAYQRAFRLDPESASIVRPIVSLAVQLQRQHEAIRYALILVDLSGAEPPLLRQLAMYLNETGESDRAVAVFEKALAAEDEASPSPESIVVRIEAGRLRQLAGDHAAAAEHFRHVQRVLDAPERFLLDDRLRALVREEAASLYSLFAETFLEADAFDEAETAFRRADEAEPGQARLAYGLARVAARRELPAEALGHLEAAFDAGLTDAGVAPYELFAELLTDLERQEEILPRLEALAEAEPENVPLAYALAEQYRRAGRRDEAVAAFEELVREHPTLTGYRSLTALYGERQQFGAMLDLMGQSVDQTGTVLLLEDEDEPPLDDAQLDGLAAEAQRRLDAGGEPSYDVSLAAALVLSEGERHDEAAPHFEAALAARPEAAAETLVRWGLGLLIAERYAEAAEVFQRGLDEGLVAEDNPAANHYLATALALSDRFDEALAAARRAAAETPDAPRFTSRVGWILFRARQNDEARETFLDLIERFDDERASLEVREILREARLLLSHLAYLDGDLPQAEEWLEEVLDEFPRDPGALNDLGYLWADEGKHLHRALPMIRRAVEADPENAAYRDSLGWVYYRLGRFEEAVVELERAAASAREPDPEILDHLGDAYRAVGRNDEALDAWRRAAAAYRERDEAEEAEAVEAKVEEHESRTEVRESE